MLKAYKKVELQELLNKSKMTIHRRVKQDKFVPVSFTKWKKEVIRRLLRSDLDALDNKKISDA